MSLTALSTTTNLIPALTPCMISCFRSYHRYLGIRLRFEFIPRDAIELAAKHRTGELNYNTLGTAEIKKILVNIKTIFESGYIYVTVGQIKQFAFDEAGLLKSCYKKVIRPGEAYCLCFPQGGNGVAWDDETDRKREEMKSALGVVDRFLQDWCYLKSCGVSPQWEAELGPDFLLRELGLSEDSNLY